VNRLAGEKARIGAAQHTHHCGNLAGLAATPDRRHLAPMAGAQRRLSG